MSPSAAQHQRAATDTPTEWRALCWPGTCGAELPEPAAISPSRPARRPVVLARTELHKPGDQPCPSEPGWESPVGSPEVAAQSAPAAWLAGAGELLPLHIELEDTIDECITGTDMVYARRGNRPMPSTPGGASEVSVDGIVLQDAEASQVRQRTFQEFWKRYDSEPDPEILAQIRLRKDGGLKEEWLQKLWTDGNKVVRYFSAANTLLSVVCNVSYTIYLDISTIYFTENHGGFHLLDDFVPFGLLDRVPNGSVGVAMFVELLLMVYLLAHLSRELGLVVCTKGDDGGRYWLKVYRLVWLEVPRLTTASAMRFLQYVHPTVLVNDLLAQLEFVAEDWHMHSRNAVCRLLWFVLKRLFFLWLGVEVFMVKFRAVAEIIMEDSISLNNTLAAFTFLFQVMGIVNINIFTQQRLNIFVFGGQDGVLTSKEKGLQEVYYAMLAKRLWREYSKKGGLGRWRAVVIMLSFTDFDFQDLVLAEPQHRKTLAQDLVLAEPQHRKTSDSNKRSDSTPTSPSSSAPQTSRRSLKGR